MATIRAAALLACVAAVLSGPGSSARAETLMQALSSTYTYNPELDAERARLRATDEEVPRARAGHRPTISGSADVGREYQNISPDTGSDGITSPRGYSVDVTQPVFTGFRATNAVREAEAGVRAGREQLRDVERRVFLSAVSAYVDVVRDGAIVRLRENNVNVLTRELEATKSRFEVGEVTRTDLAQARARRAGAQSELDLARANLKSSRAAYERIVGNPPSNLRRPPLPERRLPRSLPQAKAIAERENALIIASLYREQAARHTVGKIRGELLPQLQLEARYSDRYDSSKSIERSESASIAGRLNVPFYQGGEVHARVRQAKHTHVARLQEVEQSRTEVREAVVSAWAQLMAARAQVRADQTQVDANETALDGVRAEEKVGQRTLLDVLNAEQELLNARVQLVTDQRNLVVAAYTVLSAIGRLDSLALQVADVVYDPEVHYDEVRRKWWGLSITHTDGRREKLDLWESHGRAYKD